VFTDHLDISTHDSNSDCGCRDFEVKEMAKLKDEERVARNMGLVRVILVDFCAQMKVEAREETEKRRAAQRARNLEWPRVVGGFGGLSL
jgi:hypothetical protein